MKCLFKAVPEMEKNQIYMEAQSESEEVLEIIELIEKKKTNIQATLRGEVYWVPVEEIFCFYSSEKKVFAKTKDQDYQVNQRLYELLETLPRQFLRISHTEIINLKYVTKFQLTPAGLVLIFFSSGYQTSSSRRYLKKIKERLL